MLAQTSKGRALTEAHRKAQIRNAGIYSARAGAAYNRLLNVEDLDGSALALRVAMDQIAFEGNQRSVQLARQYEAQFADAEGFEAPQVPPIELNRGKLAADVQVTGPVAVKKKIATGVAADSAKADSLSLLMGTIKQSILNGGRDFIIGGTKVKYSGQHGRWRRVTDGKPCAFCAMLASRGPVYSDVTVTFEAHPFCGCGAEQVVGDWEPTELEAQWIGAYGDAAGAANKLGLSRTRQDTLWRMRRARPDLFNDGVLDPDKEWRLLKYPKQTLKI